MPSGKVVQQVMNEYWNPIKKRQIMVLGHWVMISVELFMEDKTSLDHEHC